MLNKEDINLPSDILILTLFPKKSIFSTIQQQLNSTIIEILHNNKYQQKIYMLMRIIKKQKIIIKY